MELSMTKIKETIITIGWAIKLALHIDAKILLGWGTFSVLLAILPAIALHFNRQAVSILSGFLISGQGEFSDVLPSILALGLILTAVGLSRRVNASFLYFIMYDAYYFGLEEYMMDAVQRIEIKTIMDKKYRDDYYSVLGRCGALADFMSSGCLFLSKMVGVVSLLVVAARTSTVIFAIAAVYIIVILIFNLLSLEKLRWDHRPYWEAARLANYYQNSAMTPGVAKEMRIYGLSEETVANWDNAYDHVENIDKRFAKVRQINVFISGIGFYLFLSVMMTYSIFRIADGGMTVDVFLMLYVMGQSISEVMQIVSSSLQETERGLFFLHSQRTFVQSVPQNAKDWMEGFEPADENIVFKAESLCFSYDDKNDVLHDITSNARLTGQKFMDYRLQCSRISFSQHIHVR